MKTFQNLIKAALTPVMPRATATPALPPPTAILATLPPTTTPLTTTPTPTPTTIPPTTIPNADLLPQLTEDYIYAQTCNFEKLSDAKEIGSGNQATVYSATYKGKPVAAKKFTVAQEFMAEMAPMTRLRSPYTEPVLGIDREHHTLLMPLRKRSLESLVREKGSLTFSWPIILNIALALSHMHASGYVHRDVKLSNVLIDEDGSATLADYGLSYKRGNQNFNLVTGTAMYMASELFGNNDAIDLIKTDIYSLGTLILEMAIGYTNYGDLFPSMTFDIAAQTAYGRTHRIFINEIDNLKKKPNMQVACELITACIDKDPSKRPSIEDIINIIRKEIPHALAHTAERPIAPPPQEELFYWVDAKLQPYLNQCTPYAPANTNITTFSDATIIKNACKSFEEHSYNASTFFYRSYIKRKVESAISCDDKAKQIPSIIDGYAFGLGM